MLYRENLMLCDKKRLCVLAVCLCALAAVPAQAGDVFHMSGTATSLEFVTVGNPGNPGELSGAGAGGAGADRISGAVGYVYQMGKFEVTVGQYTVFLNAVAKTDTYGLYFMYMAGSPDPYGCGINRSGTSGSYIYTIRSGRDNYPVNYVSWGTAARFCNWLTNGQPVGAQDLTTTEDGSYLLNSATTESALLAVTRKANAQYVLPTEDEWHKAAYHKNDGPTGNYWLYPTGTNTAPTSAILTPDPGNGANFGYAFPDPRTTQVGEYENSASPYGTFDQGGNLAEFTEDLVRPSGLWRREHLGGSWGGSGPDSLSGIYRGYGSNPAYPDANDGIGFRVAVVPEPVSASLLMAGFVVSVARRRAKA
jgi:formylglycine-generating enzyme